MEGTSFLYSFDDPSAAERHTVQYFEIYGNRAIYKDGWWAACMLDRIPWDASPPTIARFAPGTYDPEQDRWELYYLPEDFTQAHDLAAEHPQKLAELKEPGARHQRLAGPLVAHSYIDSSLFALTRRPAMSYSTSTPTSPRRTATRSKSTTDAPRSRPERGTSRSPGDEVSIEPHPVDR